MAELTFPQVHSQIAWDNWLSQFVGKKKLQAYVVTITQPLDVLDIALQDLLTKRDPENATGVQLDGVGDIVGQPRFVAGAFTLSFFGYEGQPAVTGYDQARYRRLGESTEDTGSQIDDTTYRRLINWKIVMNTANGTVEDIIRAMQALFPDTVKVTVTTGPRTVDVKVVVRNDINSVFAQNLDLYVPKLAGATVTASITKQA